MQVGESQMSREAGHLKYGCLCFRLSFPVCVLASDYRFENLFEGVDLVSLVWRGQRVCSGFQVHDP